MIRHRQEFRILPQDFSKNVATGIKLPFDRKRIFALSYTTKDQIKSNLINFILTNEGERVFNVNFGGNIRSLLFEPNTSNNELRLMLLDRIGFYFPQITINDLSFTSNDLNQTFISIKYSINKSEDNLILQING